MNSLNHLFRTLGQAFRRCATRFPVTTVFAFALTAFLCYLTATEATQASGKLLMTLGYYFSTGTLLSLSLHLWGEEVKRIRLRQGVHLTAQLLLAADALFLYAQSMEPRLVEIGIAHGAAILAIGLSVFFLPFFREKDDIPAWNFAQYALGTLALTVIVGAVMSGGISLLALSLHQLFGVDVSYKCYLYILIMCSELLPLLMFLGLLPEGERKHDRLPQPTAFVRNIIRYLFLPLTGGYLLVLYVYAVRILTQWELPNGWVSWLVITLMAGCIAIEMGLYPSRVKNRKPTDERIARWLPALILPLLVLMSVGIGRRFLDYGITLNRLYLATLNAWFYFVCIGLIAGKAKRISWIPISFSIIFLLTSVLPVNYASITRNTLRREVKELMTQSGLDTLPLDDAQYRAWLKSLPEGGEQANEKLYYLSEIFGEESFADLVNKDIPFYAIREEQTPDARNLHYTSQVQNIPIPKGCSLFTGINLNTRIPNEDIHDERLSVPLTPVDSISLPIDTLRARDKDGTLPPPMFRTQAGNVLLLSSFHIYIYKEETEVTLDGYLFHHEQIHK